MNIAQFQYNDLNWDWGNFHWLKTQYKMLHLYVCHTHHRFHLHMSVFLSSGHSDPSVSTRSNSREKCTRPWKEVPKDLFICLFSCNRWMPIEWTSSFTLWWQKLKSSNVAIGGYYAPSKELVPFTHLVKVRRGQLVLALPNIWFSWIFYQIISGTKYE